MRVAKVEARTVKTYTVTIEDGEVRAQPWSRAGRRYQVDSVEVVKRDGNISSVKLAGAVVKKDGSAGLQRADEHLYRTQDWPEWLHGVVGGLA
jgi:hypothetical protein